MTDMGPEEDVGGTPDASSAPGGAEPKDADPAATSSLRNQELEQLKNLLLFLPRLVVLLGKLVLDPETSNTDKLLLGAVAVYIASPLDIIPDFVPIIGQLDDIYLVALCLLRFMNRSGEAKLRQHWDGPEDIVHVLNVVTDFATRYLPAPARNAVRKWVERRDGGAA